MKRKQNGQHVHFETWSQVIEALRCEYTLSYKDVCLLFQASRKWVQRYIVPNVRTLYLSSNFANDKIFNWQAMASMKLNKPIKEAVWFHREDLEELIENSVFSVTKQTKKIPLAYLMTAENAKKYDKILIEKIKEIEEIKKKNDEELTSYELYYWLRDNAVELALPYIEEKFKELTLNIANPTKRTEVSAYTVEMPPKAFYQWQSVHHRKSYGDIDETIYRELFSDGWVRIEVAIPDANGEVSKKVYYIPDPNPILFDTSDFVYAHRKICVPEELWKKYNKE